MVNSIRFLQGNLHHAKAANSCCAQFAVERSCDVICVSEPYTYMHLVTGFPKTPFKLYAHEEDPRACLLVRNSLDCLLVFCSRDVTAVNLQLSTRSSVMAVSVYLSPTEPVDQVLNVLSGLLGRGGATEMVIMGDFNAKSPMWGGDLLDSRGRAVQDWIATHGLLVANDPNSIPTFDCIRGQSWIDLTLLRTSCPDRYYGWRVWDDENLSDHRFVTLDLRLTVRQGNLSAPKRINWRRVDKSKLALSIKSIFEECPRPTDSRTLISSLDGLNDSLLRATDLATRSNPRGAVVRSAVLWWTDELTIQKSKCRALRRRLRASGDSSTREAFVNLYRRERAVFTKMVQVAKHRSFRSYLDKLTSKAGYSPECKSFMQENTFQSKLEPVSTDRGTTSDSVMTVKAIMAHHFRRVNEPRFRSAPRIDLEEVPYSENEVTLALSELQNNKATGLDGLPIEVLKLAHSTDPEYLTAIMNACRDTRCFPRAWKNARCVLIAKHGRDLSSCDSYRPLSLVSSWGKLLDKLMYNRLRHFVESRGLLSEFQFGFRKHRSAVDALQLVDGFIRTNRGDGLHTVLLSFDIKGAFDTVRWTDVLRELYCLGIPLELFHLYGSFLDNRLATYCGRSFRHSVEYNCGVPQGSCSGPLLWIIVANSLLRHFERCDFFAHDKLVAFADDFLFVLKARNREEVIAKTKRAALLMSAWCKSHHLKLSVGKTQLLIVSPRRVWNYRLKFDLDGGSFRNSTQIRYLGVMFDDRHSFTAHLDLVERKARKVLQKLARVTRPTWGLGGKTMKALYSTVLEKIILYGCEVWYRNTGRQDLRLSQIQRSCLLLVTKSYRTVSNEALLVLAGVMPLEYSARIRQALYLCKRGVSDIDLFGLTFSRDCAYGPRGHTVNPYDLVSVDFDDIPPTNRGWEIFTDGSKMDTPHAGSRVGAAFVAYQDTELVYFGVYRLADCNSVFDAELYAILQALLWALRNLSDGKLRLHSDSRSSLLALRDLTSYHPWVVLIKTTLSILGGRGVEVSFGWVPAHTGISGNEEADALAKSAASKSETDASMRFSWAVVGGMLKKAALKWWQERWDSAITGRWTHSLLPQVTLRRCESDFYLNQILTGHGIIPEFQLKRFGKSGLCPFDGELGTVDHLVYHCRRNSEIRKSHFPISSRPSTALSLTSLVQLPRVREGLRKMIVLLFDELDP